MLTPVRSSQFKRDVKTAKSRGKNTAKLRDVLSLLVSQAAPWRPASRTSPSPRHAPRE